jgi:REP element-mobilizing transposase RayT
MIHGYHVILPFYGFWLPNDPRGSWSEFVWKWELARFGKATRSPDRRDVAELSPAERLLRDQARAALSHSPVCLTGRQALSVANGFAFRVRRSRYTAWACAILPEHVHLVLARHNYRVEQMVKLLKAAASIQLSRDNLHPFATQNETTPAAAVWAESFWKVYLDSEQQIENAIQYVNENPLREDMPQQSWAFVTPFPGLEPGRVTYH